jgi:FHA domain
MVNQLTVEWTEAGVRQHQTIQHGQPSKNQGIVRIGRDPSKCDIILSHPTVSGLHIEIIFNQQLQEFQVRNLRLSNPPLIDGKILAQGEAKLIAGSRIHLGEVELQVVSLSVTEVGIPHRVLLCEEKTPASSPTGPSRYGLQCPKCHRISPYAQLSAGCPWCGTSLAAAASVLVAP